MESKIISGVDASGMLAGSPCLSYEIRSINLDIPLDEVGLSDPHLTVSGSQTGAYTFHSSTEAKIRFRPNEDIYITTTNFSGDYSAIINYLQAGDMTSYMQADTARSSAVEGTNTFWRYRT